MSREVPQEVKAEERALLVVAAWPKALSEHDRSILVEEATGEPRAYCAGLARRATPAVLMAGARSRMREAALKLRSSKVPAMYPSKSDLEDLLPPFATRRLVRAEGAPFPLYMCEPMTTRVEGRGLDLRSVRLLVKGRLKRFTVKTEAIGSTGNSWMNDSIEEGFGVPESGSVSQRTGMMGDVLDLWTDEGRAVRIDGRKFDFSILGERRGLTDSENMAALAIHLGEQAPLAHIELGFSEFAPMVTAVVRRVMASGATIRREDDGPAFDLYSSLCALVERALRKRAR
ncbi:MAG: hypothetical protein ACT4PL_14865 [Phycisphaerales bacterium]